MRFLYAFSIVLNDCQQDDILTNEPSIKQLLKVVGLEDKLPDVKELPTISRKGYIVS